MSVQPGPVPSAEEESDLITRARAGDSDAMGALLEPWRRPLYAYLYRMVARREDAEDLLQDTLLRAIDRVSRFRGEARFKSWLFEIATNVALDHLRKKKRWRVETQLEGEARARANPERMAQVASMMARPDFAFDIREHIAFCFSCLARSLEPEEQAAIFLKEVMGFSSQEGASILGSSEPQFRHRLAAARSSMTEAYEGMCQLINKTGACWQCRGLRELAPEANQGPDLVRIEVRPGVPVTPETLFEARLEIVRTADLEEGAARKLHEDFFEAVNRAES
jgi:RNA polymerase sigma-70 factor (ECF subfamily)